MIQFVVFLVIGLVGVWLGYNLAVRRKMKKASRDSGRSREGMVAREQDEKEVNMEKLRKALRGMKSITNDEVERLIGVSHATATRYLDDLEKEGLVEQIGEVGQGVVYRLK